VDKGLNQALILPSYYVYAIAEKQLTMESYRLLASVVTVDKNCFPSPLEKRRHKEN
jgi:hypothetical protein